MVHRRPLPFDAAAHSRVEIARADLGDPGSLEAACESVDRIVHLAGVLFAPHPEVTSRISLPPRGRPASASSCS
jgi:uncharacterized protein YbjT (DUF2867 family)